MCILREVVVRFKSKGLSLIAKKLRNSSSNVPLAGGHVEFLTPIWPDPRKLGPHVGPHDSSSGVGGAGKVAFTHVHGILTSRFVSTASHSFTTWIGLLVDAIGWSRRDATFMRFCGLQARAWKAVAAFRSGNTVEQVKG